MIYLVEDDDNIRKLVKYALEKEGFEVTGFSVPKEFWKAMHMAIPELVILDIMLPEEDGLSILKRLKENNKTEKENVIMEKTMEIKGMMCGHCEAAVKKALEALPEVARADVSHEKGTAVVTLQAEVADAVLKKAVEEKDYEVVSVQ